MDDQFSVRRDLLDHHLALLLSSFQGPRKDIRERELQQAFDEKRYTDMVAEMKAFMNIECRMRIGYVKFGGPQNAGAWIKLPRLLPFYQSSTFHNLHITMYIRKEKLENASFTNIARTFAHELSHVVLEMLHHPLRNFEEAVDLTAMILGFRSIYVRGSICTYRHQGVERSMVSGYLTYAEVLYASRKIEQLT